MGMVGDGECGRSDCFTDSSFYSIMTLDKRIEKTVMILIPFRDRGCLVKTIEDRRDQAIRAREIKAKIIDWRHENQLDYLNDLIKEHERMVQSL